MKEPLHKILKPIKEVQDIRGVKLPVGLEFRQLVVTGPPGAGKTYYINQIRGWPNEGYLDLTKKGWWRDKTLIYRPREVHLGLPYKGFRESITVFDQEWLEAPREELALDYGRIRLPPGGHSLFSSDWRDRYIFEFLIPEAEQIYEQRSKRQDEGYFPVDANLSMDMVVRQVEAYSDVALYLHRAGLNVYIRRDIEQAPMLITEKGSATLPTWVIPEVTHRSNLKTWEGWKRLLLRQNSIPWFTVTDALQELNQPSRIPHDGKSLDITLGRQHLRLSPEIPLGASKKYLRLHKNWIVRQPKNCSVKTIRGFARIRQGETVILGRSNDQYTDLFDLKKPLAKRHVSITNTKGDLLITPLEREVPIKVVRLEQQDTREQITANKLTAMLQVRDLMGGSLSRLESKSALSLLQEVNRILSKEPYRPLDPNGLPGGLLELPAQQTPVLVGDLHGQVDNLLTILTENCLLEALGADKAFLCILGDAVHSEIAQEMEDMEGSILMMDLIFSLKRKYPANVFYLRGNHDDFSPELSKNGIPQGLLMRKALEETRGTAYVEAMQTFYDRLPYLIVNDSFISCHAGPPLSETNREQIVNHRAYPRLSRQLVRNRVKRPHNLAGYGKSDIKALRKIFGAAKGTPVIVGHTPLDPFGSTWQNVGAIKNHHIVYSAHQQGPGFFIRIRDKMVPQSYPAEPLVKLISKLE